MPSLKDAALFAGGVILVLAVLQLLAEFGGVDILAMLPRNTAAATPPAAPTKVG